MPTIKEMYGGFKEATQADLNRLTHKMVRYNSRNLKGGWFVGGYVTKDSFKNTSPNSDETPMQSSKLPKSSEKSE